MPNESLKQLYIDELRDLFIAENQLVKALPKMAKAGLQTNYVLASKNIWNKRRSTSNVLERSLNR